VFATGSVSGFFQHFIAKDQQDEQKKSEDQHWIKCFCEKNLGIDRWMFVCVAIYRLYLMSHNTRLRQSALMKY